MKKDNYLQTNMNRDVFFHDLIKFESIEKQLLDMFTRAGILEGIEYHCNRNGRYFTFSNTELFMPFEFNNKEIQFRISGDTSWLTEGEGDHTYDRTVYAWYKPTWMNSKREFKIKDDLYSKIVKMCQDVLKLNNYMLEAKKMIADYDTEEKCKKKAKRINEYLKGYFDDSLYTIDFDGISPLNFFSINPNTGLFFNNNKGKDEYGVTFYVDKTYKIFDVNERFKYAVAHSECSKDMNSTCMTDLDRMSIRAEKLKLFKKQLEEFDASKNKDLKEFIDLNAKTYKFKKKVWELTDKEK